VESSNGSPRNNHTNHTQPSEIDPYWVPWQYRIRKHFDLPEFGNGPWELPCPLHSNHLGGHLSIAFEETGRPDVRCRSGCDWESILKARGLRISDMMLKPGAGLPAEMVAANQYAFDPITAAALDCGDYTPQWLVKNILVAMQPAVIGGGHKAMKTTTGLDLAISLATGTPFLGQFQIPAAKRVCFLSGESGEHTIQETSRRICAARGFTLGSIADMLHFEFTLPQLAETKDRAELQSGIRDLRCEVVFLDPLYLALGGAASDAASNVYAMGPLLLNVARACLDVGCTPALLHHYRTTGRGNDKYNVPSLDDLAFAGIKEYARQWLLLNRREEYTPGSGMHRLWLSVGGSMGHGGLWGYDADEGQLDENFRGRHWHVTVTNPGDAREAAQTAKNDAKDRDREKKDRDFDTRLLKQLDRLDPSRTGCTFEKLKNAIHCNTAKLTEALDRLEGVLEVVAVQYKSGKGGKATKTTDGVRRINVPSTFEEKLKF
jgi:replicative DNA helicase